MQCPNDQDNALAQWIFIQLRSVKWFIGLQASTKHADLKMQVVWTCIGHGSKWVFANFKHSILPNHKGVWGVLGQFGKLATFNTIHIWNATWNFKWNYVKNGQEDGSKSCPNIGQNFSKLKVLGTLVPKIITWDTSFFWENFVNQSCRLCYGLQL